MAHGLSCSTPHVDSKVVSLRRIVRLDVHSNTLHQLPYRAPLLGRQGEEVWLMTARHYKDVSRVQWECIRKCRGQQGLRH